jgi:ring-1,2-phenylacetyl-CoA epoxidase subunit PaaC
MNDNLINYCLFLADTTLILSHRNSQWCGHGPILEQDIAITNISLDLLGQARNFYQYAALLKGDTCSEDVLAYHRNANEFKNLILVEQPKNDWAFTIVRQFYFSTFQKFYYQQLQHSSNQQLAAIATKSLKEIAYHVRWSSEWMLRLGDGTQLSNSKMQTAINELQNFVAEMFIPTIYEQEMLQQNIGVDLKKISTQWQIHVAEVLQEATLLLPNIIPNTLMGKQGNHTPHLENLLEEMQFLQREMPNCEW